MQGDLLHEIIYAPQYVQACVFQQFGYCLPVLRPVHFAVASFVSTIRQGGRLRNSLGRYFSILRNSPGAA
jgi:hypothetical protein